jgi:hypothetical protein
MALVVFFPAQMKGSRPRPGPRILVLAPAAAGGLTRDYAAERTIYRAALAQLHGRFKPAWLGAASSYTAAVYDEPGRTDRATKAPVRLVFLGVDAASSFAIHPPGSATTWLASPRASPAMGRSAVQHRSRRGQAAEVPNAPQQRLPPARRPYACGRPARPLAPWPLPPVTQASAS